MMEWLIVQFLDPACVIVGNFLLVVLCLGYLYVSRFFE